MVDAIDMEKVIIHLHIQWLSSFTTQIRFDALQDFVGYESGQQSLDRFGHTDMSLIGICQMLGFGSSAESSDLSVDPSRVGSSIGLELCFLSLS